MSGCVLLSVCMVGEVVGLPMAFWIALDPGLKSALILCAVSCLICVCCIVRSSLVRVVCRILAAVAICCRSVVMSVWEVGLRETWRGS